MSFYVPGAKSVTSTQTSASNPTTATIIASLPSSRFTHTTRTADVAAWVYLGADTSAWWWIEHCVSSGLGSTAISNAVRVRTVTGGSGQFCVRFPLAAPTDFIRVRLGSTFTGTADATIQGEEIS